MAQPITAKALVNSIRMVYLAQVICVVFAAVVLLTIRNGEVATPELIEIFRYVAIGIMMVGIPSSFFLYKRLVANVDPALTLREKFAKLQAAILIRCALLEVPALFGIVCAYQTGDLNFLIMSAIMLALMLSVRPTIETMCTDLQLSESERATITSDSGMVS